MAKLFLTILFIFGAIMIGVFFLGPEWQGYQKLNQESGRLQGISKKLDEISLARDELNSQINKISAEDRERLIQAVPEGTHATEFLVLMENLTRANGLILSSIDISSAAPQKTPSQAGKTPAPGASPQGQTANFQQFSEYPITLTLSGSYESFKNFIKDLEQNIRFIDIVELNFASPSRKNEVITFAVKLKTYYQ